MNITTTTTTITTSTLHTSVGKLLTSSCPSPSATAFWMVADNVVAAWAAETIRTPRASKTTLHPCGVVNTTANKFAYAKIFRLDLKTHIIGIAIAISPR